MATTCGADSSIRSSALLPRAGVRLPPPHPASALSGLSAQASGQHQAPIFRCVPSLRSVKSHSSSHFCLQVVLLYASTYVLVALSIDRYHAIVHPMKFLQGGELPNQPLFPRESSWGGGCFHCCTPYSGSLPPFLLLLDLLPLLWV